MKENKVQDKEVDAKLEKVFKKIFSATIEQFLEKLSQEKGLLEKKFKDFLKEKGIKELPETEEELKSFLNKEELKPNMENILLYLKEKKRIERKLEAMSNFFPTESHEKINVDDLTLEAIKDYPENSNQKLEKAMYKVMLKIRSLYIKKLEEEKKYLESSSLVSGDPADDRTKRISRYIITAIGQEIEKINDLTESELSPGKTYFEKEKHRRAEGEQRTSSRGE